MGRFNLQREGMARARAVAANPTAASGRRPCPLHLPPAAASTLTAHKLTVSFLMLTWVSEACWVVQQKGPALAGGSACGGCLEVTGYRGLLRACGPAAPSVPCVQAVVWVRRVTSSHTTPATFYYGMAAQLCLGLAALSLMQLRPVTYLRHRHSLVFCAACICHVPPNSRSLGGMAMALQRPASPGTLGALADAAQLLVGTRTLLRAVCGFFLPLPLPLQLVASTMQYLLTRAAYCSTQVGTGRGAIHSLARWLPDSVLCVPLKTNRPPLCAERSCSKTH